MALTRRNHGTGHSYTADGQPMPGVTTILQQAAKPALIKWAAETTANYAVDHWRDLGRETVSARLQTLYRCRNEERDRAARRGTEVHRLAEQLAAGIEVDIPEPLAGHVASYVSFLDTFNPEPVGLELVVGNREVGYCGTADLVADMLGDVWLLELKTSRSGIYRESALQACAYSRAETFTTDPTPGAAAAETPLADLGISRCGAVHIRADGYDLRPLDTGSEVWAYFRHLVGLHYADDASRLWVGDAIEPLRAAS